MSPTLILGAVEVELGVVMASQCDKICSLDLLTIVAPRAGENHDLCALRGMRPSALPTLLLCFCFFFGPCAKVELFFAPNSTKMFNFRAGCAARHGCPEGYTRLMCTDFLNNVKVRVPFLRDMCFPSLQTCRLCCFESNCIDPTPGSDVRVSVMKDLLLQSGFYNESINKYLARENEIAQNRGVTTTTTRKTTTTMMSTTPTPTTTSEPMELCKSTPRTTPQEDFDPNEWTDEDELDSTTTVRVEDEGDLDSPDREVRVDEAEEVKKVESKTVAGERPDVQEMDMNDQTYNEEPSTRTATAVLWKASRDATTRSEVGIKSTLLIALLTAVGAIRAAL
ncbi:unnamed protein product [Hydatigera taeniaeformis]|uniref:CLIP domain-containing serine protease n=1 Tax=Hydatigena taeniaeformis TaxID=6205 RepID=A0A0R3X1M5_HYDTA|nr:unnamed protein product [Hydatigera taeniaeformis]